MKNTAPDPSLSSYTHMDAMILNIERACQAAIDSSMHLIATQKMGIPKNSADAFTLMQGAGLITKELAKRLKAMTGFRNIAVHQYQDIDADILHYIAKSGWKDFVTLFNAIGVKIDPQP